MKHFIMTLFVICTTCSSILQAQEKVKTHEIIAKFQISDGTENGLDITPTLLEQNTYLVIYQDMASKAIYMANFWEKNNTQSYGFIYSMEEKHIKGDDKNYETDLFYFQWGYINTYDNKKGTAKVELMKIYKLQGVYFKMTIIPENLNVLVYRGFMKGTLDLTVYDK
ncbi:hypothetical protein ACM55K_06815 [Flavobacterium sp. LT1R49]|uniref:hypothetical protein n=1 Tax=Flavobacterium arabinosi TaxID=3398737 RepID=UPI003A8461CB